MFTTMDVETRCQDLSEEDVDNEDTASSEGGETPDLFKLNGVVENSFENAEVGEKWNGDNEGDKEELQFDEVPLSPSMQRKKSEIENILSELHINQEQLRTLALSEGGLINDELRKIAWPRMLGIDINTASGQPSQAELENHREYQQVVLDVNRSLKRFPPGIPYEQRVALQDQLTRLILRVIIKYPHLRYYQGYHDVAVTFLLVVGESVAFQIMEKLSTSHLKDCMEATMEKTSYLLNYIYPLIKRLHQPLYDYMERSEVGTMFCLPWFLTWYGHSLNKYRDVVRLYDFFLASPPLMPLYLAAVLVVHRQDEIFSVDCDMASIHALLSTIPDDLDFEPLLKKASDLYERFPPESIEREVAERSRKEFQTRKVSSAVSRRWLHPIHFYNYPWRWLDWHRFIPHLAGIANQAVPQRRYTRYFVVPTLVSTLVLVYAYFRVADAYDCDLLLSVR